MRPGSPAELLPIPVVTALMRRLAVTLALLFAVLALGERTAGLQAWERRRVRRGR
jgi:hypothetical protein